jgi:hypothetical protein
VLKALVMACVAALLPAASASAATIQSSGGVLAYDGGPGGDVVAITVDAGTVTFTASQYPAHVGGLLTSAPCSAPSGGVVQCPVPARLAIQTRDGEDRIAIAGATFPVAMDGGSNDDTLLGGAEPDTVRGGPGDDVLGLGGGADDLRGDDGTDSVRIVGFSAGDAIRISLDDKTDDGRRSDGANVHADVEDVEGGSSDETVTGTSGRNVISTGAGSDVIDGLGGFDDISAGVGVDHVSSRDGLSDRVDCGDGFDSVIADTLDFLTECDQLDVTSALEPDSDHDGYPRQVDCDDRNPAIAPGRTDPPGNGIDEDCDGHDTAVLDRDGDGIPVPLDCDDGNAGVRPGAPEVYGNAVDEDCNGRGDPFQTLNAKLAVSFRSDPRRTTLSRVLAFRVAGVAPGTRIEVGCRGKGCPFKTLGAVASGSALNLLGKLRKARLGAGAVLTLVLRRDDALTTTIIYTLRRGIAKTKHGCTRPDDGRAVPCDITS